MSNDLHVSLFSKVIVRSNSNNPQGNFNNVNCEWEVGCWDQSPFHIHYSVIISGIHLLTMVYILHTFTIPYVHVYATL